VVDYKKRIANARLGGLRCIELHGNPGTPEGRSRGGRKTTSLFSQNPALAKSLGFVTRKEIKYPPKSEELAELIGIILGDAGNKVRNQVDIPSWIHRNIIYQKACLRGLIDTDGSFYLHEYKLNGQKYRYLKLCFTNRSKPLLNSAFAIFKNLRLKAYLDGDHVSIYSRPEIKRYFQEIGSHNPKHLHKFKKHCST